MRVYAGFKLFATTANDALAENAITAEVSMESKVSKKGCAQKVCMKSKYIVRTVKVYFYNQKSTRFKSFPPK